MQHRSYFLQKVSGTFNGSRSGIFTTLLFFGLFFLQYSFGAPAAVQIQALDENGRPMQNVEVEVSSGTSGHQKVTNFNGIADIKWENHSITARCDTGTRNGFPKEGYYYTGCRMTFFKDKEFNPTRYEPCDALVRLHVRRKIDPVPMFVNVGKIGSVKKYPTGNEEVYSNEIAYDLEKGDFCPPYGAGVVKDFVFIIRMNLRANQSH